MRRLLTFLGVTTLFSSAATYAAYIWVDRALGRLKW